MKRTVLIGVVFATLPLAADIDTGKRLFEGRCAACHGADGAGGERGPNIVDARRGRVRSKDALREVIRKGVPEGGMPAFNFSEPDMDSVLVFLGALTAPAVDRPAPGNAAAPPVIPPSAPASVSSTALFWIWMWIGLISEYIP